MSAFELIRRIERLERRVTELEAASPKDQLDRTSLAESFKQRFGKYPHHFMSAQRIREALGGR